MRQPRALDERVDLRLVRVRDGDARGEGRVLGRGNDAGRDSRRDPRRQHAAPRRDPVRGGDAVGVSGEVGGLLRGYPLGGRHRGIGTECGALEEVSDVHGVFAVRGGRLGRGSSRGVGEKGREYRVGHRRLAGSLHAGDDDTRGRGAASVGGMVGGGVGVRFETLANFRKVPMTTQL